MGHEEGLFILAAGGLLALGLVGVARGRPAADPRPRAVPRRRDGCSGPTASASIEFDDYHLARTIGIIALALILFEGGLAAGFPEIRPVLGSALSLALARHAADGDRHRPRGVRRCSTSRCCEGMLVGSIVSATDGAAIFALLRGSTLKRRLARTLEGEAGMNDPVAVLLVIGFIEWIRQPDYGVLDMGLLFVQQLGIGAVVGARRRLARGAGVPARQPRDRRPVPRRVAGGRRDRVRRRRRAARLGLPRGLPRGPGDGVDDAARAPDRGRVPRRPRVARAARRCSSRSACSSSRPTCWTSRSKGTALALVLVFVARPLAVMVATAFAPLRTSERIVLGWAGLRGAVPVVLATFPIIEGIPDARAVLQHRVLRRARLDAAAGLDVHVARRQARRARRASRRCAARSSRSGRSASSARTSSRCRSSRATRRSACACATSGCRATRSSTCSCATTRRCRRAARRAWRPATGCTCSPARSAMGGARGGARALAHGAGRPGAAARARAARPSGAPIFTTRPWTEADGDPDAPERGARPRGHRAPRHALGRARARSSCCRTGATR